MCFKLQILGIEEMRLKDWGKSMSYLVHLDEKTVNEISRVLWIKGFLIDLDPRRNEVFELLYQVVDAIVSSWQILHDCRIHVI